MGVGGLAVIVVGFQAAVFFGFWVGFGFWLVWLDCQF